MLAPIFGKPRETFKVVKNVEPVETHRILRLATLLFSVSTCLHYGSLQFFPSHPLKTHR
jgi:hypothetical protein